MVTVLKPICRCHPPSYDSLQKAVVSTCSEWRTQYHDQLIQKTKEIRIFSCSVPPPVTTFLGLVPHDMLSLSDWAAFEGRVNGFQVISAVMQMLISVVVQMLIGRKLDESLTLAFFLSFLLALHLSKPSCASFPLTLHPVCSLALPHLLAGSMLTCSLESIQRGFETLEESPVDLWRVLFLIDVCSARQVSEL